MKFQIEVTTVVEIPYNERQYPADMTPQEALSLEIEELSKDPRELMALDGHVARVRGIAVQEEQGVQHREPAEAAVVADEVEA
jgi:hypothetical protein